MTWPYEIRSTELGDLESIFKLFDLSIAYQEKNGYPVWRNYDKSALIKDIENKNQYKIIIDSKPAIVFSVCYADKIIWRHLDKGDSLYLYRIVVNPEFKGQKLFEIILRWSKEHSKEAGLNSIRMDTWASNANIIEYYKNFGFVVVENYITPDIRDLPVHNRNLELTLLEYKLNKISDERRP